MIPGNIGRVSTTDVAVRHVVKPGPITESCPSHGQLMGEGLGFGNVAECRK